MKSQIQMKKLPTAFLAFLAPTLFMGALGQTPPLCPPAGETQDYGTGCSSNPNPPPDYQSAVTSAGFATGANLLSATERAQLFSAADAVRDRMRDYLNDPNQFHRLAAGQDYFSTSPTSEWRRWYDTQRSDLINARLTYWAIYASSQEISPADRARALTGMLDTTAALA